MEHWEEAKKKESFKIFIPELKKIFAIKTKGAILANNQIDPYSFFLDEEEKGLKRDDIDLLFSEIKPKLLTIIQNVKKSKNYRQICMNKLIDLDAFSAEKQREAAYDIASRIIGDTDVFVLASSPHPFTSRISQNDVRITMGVRNDPYFSFGLTTHESGHALHSSQYAPEFSETILAQFKAVGTGLSESQSRFWENMICKSKQFWKGYYPTYRKFFPKLKLSEKEFYNAIHIIKPSCIRIEADELTYTMHIIIRYEIECGIIDGKIKIEDLENVWNEKYKEYLGVLPQKPSHGILQDVHWSMGLIGYFPAYVLGSVYAAMIYDAIKKEHPQIEKEIEKLDFSFIREWLRKNIHQYAGSKSTKEIIETACKKEINSDAFIDYLREKYYAIYSVKNRKL